MVVLAMLVIVATITIPHAASGAGPSGQAAARTLVSDLLSAQMDAVAAQEYRRVHFFDDGRGWCVLVLPSNALGDPFDQATAVYMADEVESQGQGQFAITDFQQDGRFRNVSIAAASFDGDSREVTFDPSGGIVASDGSPGLGGTVQIDSGQTSWEVQVAPLTGHITVSEVTGGNP
jgi:type II secretory pathway pseudopilin PulG